MPSGKFEEAAGSFERAVKIQGKASRAWFHLGQAYHSLGKDEEALALAPGKK
jgi:Flp pilus assembly protein TadD